MSVRRLEAFAGRNVVRRRRRVKAKKNPPVKAGLVKLKRFILRVALPFGSDLGK